MWLGMGGQWIGVRGISGLILGRTTFDGVGFKCFKWLEREDSKKVFGLTQSVFTHSLVNSNLSSQAKF